MDESKDIWQRYEKGEAILNDAPPPDAEIVQLLLRRLHVIMPVPTQFRYEAGEAVNERWKGFRAELVVIPADEHIRYWYPWIEPRSGPAEFTRTANASPSKEWDYEAVIRWRIWKQGKAHSDGFMEIVLEPDPLNKNNWRVRYSTHTYNENLNSKPLLDFFALLREKQQAGRPTAFDNNEDFLTRLEDTYFGLKKSSIIPHRPSQSQVAFAMGIARRTLQKNLAGIGIKWKKLQAQLEKKYSGN